MFSRLLNNWPYKLAAVLIAVALRFYVAAQLNPRTIVTVPLEIAALPAGLVVKDATPTIKVVVTGPSSTLDSLRLGDIVASADASNAKQGVNTKVPVRVTIVPADLHDKVQIDSYLPQTATVTLDAVVTERMPIRPMFDKTAPAGYSYGEPILKPQMVDITGSRSSLDLVRQVVVDARQAPDSESPVPLPINGAFELSAIDDQGRPVKGVMVSPSSAHVTIPVIKAPTTKTVPIVASVIGKPATGLTLSSITTDPTFVTVAGTPAQIAAITEVITRPVDVEGIAASVTRTAELVLPAGISLAKPTVVSVSVNVAPVAAPQPVAPAPAPAAASPPGAVPQ